MGLTRIRSEQISNSDYKQSVRLLQNTNVTLSGGAPAVVDGATVSAGDRILVIGQSAAAENGIYQVSTPGVGSNGSWVRSRDADDTGDVTAGMIVMVVSGTDYADTQWKLTTDDPIIVDTTELTFEQASAHAFGTISANGTSIVADSVGDTITFTPGNNISIVGNAASDTVTIGVTGIALDSINNGTSNVSVVSSGGNVTVGVGGTDDIAVFSTGGANLTGNLAVTGDINVDEKLVVSGTVASALVPDADNTYSLGNATNRWSNLFLTGDTIQLGNLQIKDTDGQLGIFQSDGETLAAVTAATVASEAAVFSDGSNFGGITDLIAVELDLGSVAEVDTVEIELGFLVQAGILQPDQVIFPTFTVSTVPIANPGGQMIYVSDETGGAVIAFSDGVNWRRVTDRQIIS